MSNGTSQRFQTVTRVGEIVEGRGEPFKVAGRVIAVFLHQGTNYALGDACPHQGAPPCDGTVEAGSVAYAWHHWRFGLADGGRIGRPKVRVRMYPVRVAEDEVRVAVG